MSTVQAFGMLGGRSRGGRMLRALGGRPKSAGTPCAASASPSQSQATAPAGGVSRAAFDNLRLVSERRYLHVKALREQLIAASIQPVGVPSVEDAQAWINEIDNR